MEITNYTKEGYQALIDELDYLKKVKLEEVKNAIGVARSFGDLSENSEYDEAKNEQAKVVARISELEELIAHAKVVDESELGDTINLGYTVVLKDLDDEDEEEITYFIVGTNEVNPLQGKISDMSPIGSALIGAKAGDDITATTPGGTLRFHVVSAEKTNKNN